MIGAARAWVDSCVLVSFGCEWYVLSALCKQSLCSREQRILLARAKGLKPFVTYLYMYNRTRNRAL